MRERMLSYIRKHGLMRPGDRVGAAVSGGADSVALLRLLLEARAELGIVLSVVHFNHKIRGADAEADEKFARELALGFQLEFHCDSFDTPAHARFRDLSLEAAARELRYAFFVKLMGERKLDRVATAHTRDDQAETVLLRFLRGAGTRGLAGIHPELRAAEQGAIVRPLLEIERQELRAYLQESAQPWREDASNRDLSFARNRLRHELLPLLARDYNPGIAEVLSDSAEIARAEQEYWQEQVRSCLPQLVAPSAGDATQSAMQLEALAAQPLAVQRRMIRALAEQQGLRLEFHHVEEVLAMARAQPDALQTRIELRHGWEAVRQQGELWFRRRSQGQQEPPAYDLALPVPREIEVAGRRIRAALLNGEELAQTRATETRVTRALLDAALAEGHLRVRNWRAGDRYWPAHTRGPKKLKELLQARHIPREQKAFWPVVASGEEIVWVPGFEAPERFQVRESDPSALLLEQLPLGQSGENRP